ncbi:IS110 family transposase [Chroococcidiopsis sp. SAG 2025]|uniref:IS110 family transposase n=1 Tax=Chroococcidiopsis sp. SAG 2025 TaxID=171389 RepID=UPI0029373723|nr:IS110 family transposase [Chroococcidiopsis sp. SAG 2025]
MPEDKNFSAINLNAAGIDIGADRHWVSVPVGRDNESVRSFGCFTTDLYAMADWLKVCGVKTVAMESTEVYWIPVFQVLESCGLEVRLVNAHYVKTVPGRKTDVLDCQWLQQLHTYGLLSGSFRPQEQICVLRSYIRQRDNLIKSACVHIQRMQKVLTQMNLQLHRVISDITGTTGMAIIRAIVTGERNPDVLASHKDGRVKASCAEIAAALTGDYRPEMVFILQQELQLYDFFQIQISACDAQIEQCLASFGSKVDVNASPLAKPKRRGKKQPGNAPQFDLRSELYRMSGVDFTQIDGLGAVSVLTLISELGLDATRFPTVKHFTSWLGLCPGSRITGGKVKSSKSRRVVNRVAATLRTAAQSLCRSHSALGGFYRRLAARLGAPKAITATAHKLARIFYRLWTTGNLYTDPGLDAYEQQYRERTLKNLKQKAQAFGLELIPISDPTECVS